jgi:hypothetical protein
MRDLHSLTEELADLWSENLCKMRLQLESDEVQLLFAGLAAFDAHHYLQCRLDKEHKACQEPVYRKQLDQVFNMTKPLVARSDIVWAAVKENFEGVAELLQVRNSAQAVPTNFILAAKRL